jgi:hypothetical protein
MKLIAARKGTRSLKNRYSTTSIAFCTTPFYREKYAINLKREFPRIPFYKDF